MRRRDYFEWRGLAIVRKFAIGTSMRQVARGEAIPFEVFETGPNKIMFGGGGAMWEALMGRWSDNFWDAGNAAIGVGNSGVAEDQTQVDLQGMSKRKGMDVKLDPGHTPDHIPFPIHVDDFTEDALSIYFSSTFGTTEANFHWREWAVFNALVGGRMLNRKADDIGMKTAGMIWQLEAQIILEC